MGIKVSAVQLVGYKYSHNTELEFSLISLQVDKKLIDGVLSTTFRFSPILTDFIGIKFGIETISLRKHEFKSRVRPHAVFF